MRYGIFGQITKIFKNSLSVIRQIVVIAVLTYSASNMPLQKLLTSKVSAAPGDGKMLLFWDGGSVPSGWTCVSCTGGDPFYQVFPRGNTSYGGTGGVASHTHSSTNSIDTTGASATIEGGAGATVSNNSHGHSLSATVQSASNLPTYRDLNIIRYNSNGEPPTIPSGAIGLFDDGSLPSGWSSYSAQNGNYVRGENTAAAIGGSNTHNHVLSLVVGAATGTTQSPRITGTTSSAALSNHTHTATGNSDTISNEPPYIETIFGKSTSNSAPPDGLIAMWDNDEPTNWTKQSGSIGNFNQKFIKGSSTFGTTGGTTAHTHADNNVTSSSAVGSGTYRNGSVSSSAAHAHNINIDNYSSPSHLPPYKDVIIAKRVPQPTFEQSGFRIFTNTDATSVGSPLAGLNTSSTLPRQGKPFRLRMTLHIASANLDIGNKNFKLQFATRSGTCDSSFSGESYSDVSPSSGAIRFYDNSTPTDGVALTTNGNDPSHSSDTIVAQTYEESNNFTSTATINSGQDGLWDFSLVDYSASASVNYCFRIVTSTDQLLDTYSQIPEIITDDGAGHMILFWDGGAAPSGWTCVSCASSDDFYQKFFRGASTYGATGGGDSHGHTGSGSVASTTGLGIEVNSGGTVSTSGHTHTVTPTINSGTFLPQYRQLNIIRADASGTPSTIPAGAIAMFDSAVPSGWTRYSAQDGNFIRGENTATVTGGSATHANTVSGTTSVGIGASAARTNGSTIASANDGHTHTLSGSVNSANNEPPYIDTILGKINSTASVPSNIITIWDNPIPGSWTNVSTSGQPFYQNFVRASASYGTTGGSSTHTHSNSIIATSGAISTGTLRSGTGNADGTHTHDVTISSISSASNIPPYIDVIIGKLTGTNNPPNSPSSLDQQRTSDFSAISVGGYSNSGQVKFIAQGSDTDNPDSLQLCIEVQQIGTGFTGTETQCGSSVGYSGSPVAIDVIITGLSNGASYHWQARIKDGGGATSSWVSFGGNAESSADFIDDSTAPSGAVYDGSSVGVDADFNDGTLNELYSNWNITDGVSGINKYEYSVGKSSGATDVVGWTNNGTTPNVSASSLTLNTSEIYYFNIRATDNAGNDSTTTSDGLRVAPTLTFSSTSGAIVFDNLNSSNNYTSTKTTTLTTSTNAYNGYTIRSFVESLLTNQYSDTINFFNGGTYASPDEWLGGDTGFGYTSNDNLVQGVNKFNPGTCAGGGTSPCFAPYSTSSPGDIVADHTSLIVGTPVTNENFIITHRVTTASSQAAGVYTSEVVYIVTASY